MSPSVDLSPTTFTRLQTHAVPLVDTIESVINRLLDAYEAKSGTPLTPTDSDDGSTARQFNPNTPCSLTHAKVLAIEFGGKPLARGDANWNGLLDAAVREARAKTKSSADLKKLLIVNFVEGEKSNEGYRLLSDVDDLGAGPGREWRLERRLPCRPTARLRAEGNIHLAPEGRRRVPRDDRSVPHQRPLLDVGLLSWPCPHFGSEKALGQRGVAIIMGKPAQKIFWSWQSDTPGKIGRLNRR
jgi:hypothetical protein